jgi:uroporphyrinogen-III synthase
MLLANHKEVAMSINQSQHQPTTGELFLDALNQATATHITPPSRDYVAFTSGNGACQFREFTKEAL